MKSLTAFNLQRWVDEHREQLRPPVCNQQVFEDNDFIVMIVGGPNSRKDYHVDEGLELFYMLEGEMLLKVIVNGRQKDVRIGEGEMLLLPPRVPHSPQRFADTVGLVVERARLPHELDGFMWFCDECSNKLYEEFVYVDDIVGQLPPIFERFWESEKNRTCSQCSAVMSRPT